MRRRKDQMQDVRGGKRLIMSGSGEGFLAEEWIEFADKGTSSSPVVSMAGRVGPELSTALAAYSVAVLLSERQSR